MQDIEEGEKSPLQSKRGKRRFSDEQQGRLARFTKCCCSAFSTLVLLALLNAISVAGIAIGSYHLDKSFCPGQPNLAPTLIVTGALAIVLSVFEGRIRVQAESGDEGEGPLRTCEYYFLNFLRLAHFCLFVYLCVIVFSLYSHVVTDENDAAATIAAGVTTAEPPAAHYCQPTLFFFAFWTVMLLFVVWGAALFTTCCFCCMSAIFGDWDD